MNLSITHARGNRLAPGTRRRAPAFSTLETLEPRTLLSSASGFAHAADHAPTHAAASFARGQNASSLRPGQGATVLSSAPGADGPQLARAKTFSGFFSSKKIGLPEFDADKFDSPVANPYFPLVHGTTYVYEGEEEDGLITTRITVTSDTKQILGITTMVVRETEELFVEDLGENRILEDTFDWFALDDEGNVWYFGEDTTSFDYDEDWNLIGTNHEGGWEAGVEGALPGILILADPVPGASYQQEFFEGEAEDQAKVLRLNANVSIDFGDFEDVMVTKEWNKLSSGSVEHKYYAPGVGLIYIEELSGGKTVKVELVEIIGP